MSGHTHVCIICWRRMNVTRDWKRNGTFITTVPNAHNRMYHADAEGEESQGRLDESGKRKAGAMLFGGSSSAGAPPPPPSSSAMAAFYVSPKDKALAAAAFFYIYSKGRVPKATFNDLWWVVAH